LCAAYKQDLTNYNLTLKIFTKHFFYKNFITCTWEPYFKTYKKCRADFLLSFLRGWPLGARTCKGIYRIWYTVWNLLHWIAYYSIDVIKNVQNKKHGTERFEIMQFHPSIELWHSKHFTLWRHIILTWLVAVIVIYSSFNFWEPLMPWSSCWCINTLIFLYSICMLIFWCIIIRCHTEYDITNGTNKISYNLDVTQTVSLQHPTACPCERCNRI
jgi:hypothetical protein